MPLGGRNAEYVGFDGSCLPAETRLGILLGSEGGAKTGRRGLVGGRIDGHFGGRGRGNGGEEEGTDEQERFAGPKAEEESASGCGHLRFLRLLRMSSFCQSFQPDDREAPTYVEGRKG